MPTGARVKRDGRSTVRADDGAFSAVARGMERTRPTFTYRKIASITRILPGNGGDHS